MTPLNRIFYDPPLTRKSGHGLVVKFHVADFGFLGLRFKQFFLELFLNVFF